MKVIGNNAIVNIIQRTLNHIDNRLIDHGKRVAFIVSKMLEEQGKYSRKQRQDICILALLHDVGAYKTEEIDQLVAFETENIWEHSIYGYLFVKYLSPLSRYAEAILFHHLNYDKLVKIDCMYQDLAQIFSLADRVDVFLTHKAGDFQELKQKLEISREKRFASEAVDIFLRAEEKHHICAFVLGELDFNEILGELKLTAEERYAYLNFLVSTIDFRSRYTVSHTITTTEISRMLASYFRLEDELRQKVFYGAMLHDLGKIGIPVEILEYPGKLSAQAMQIMRTHVDLTEQILGGDVDVTAEKIALRHHEKLDGSGYPKGLTAAELTLAERIVAVADIVSALLGVRSYKRAFSKNLTLQLVQEMSGQGKIDPEVVSMLTRHYDEIMAGVEKATRPAMENYEKITREYNKLMDGYLH